MKTPFRMNLLTLKGTPRERGRVHGETLRSQIHELMQAIGEAIREACGEHADYVHPLLEDAGFLAVATRWTPHLVEEIRGIAEGAALDFETVFAWQLLDEREWFFQRRNLGLENSCSSLGVFGEGTRPPLLAQNIDMWAVVQDYVTLVHTVQTYPRLEVFAITLPGVVGIWGLNSRGVGIGLNAMGSRLGKSRAGLGTIFVARGALSHATFEEAVQFVRGVQHATGENYLIGGPERIVDLECSANRVAEFSPYPGATRLYHANHPLVNDDLDSEYLEALVKATPEFKAAIQNSETRCQSVKTQLEAASEPVTVDTVKAILSSHESPENPVCRHRRPDRKAMTTTSIVMELSSAPVLHVASGPPCLTDFRTFRFGDSRQ